MTTYTYDGSGNVVTRTDANNHTTTYTYDNNGNVNTVTNPLGYTTTYQYDANGNKIETVEPNGKTITYGYDHANRLTSINYSDSTPSVYYSYDAAGNRTSMTDGAGTVSYTYDNDNRLLTANRGSDTFTYTYDPVGNILSRTYPDGTSITYTYNQDEQLATATNGGNTTSYTYDTAGNPLTTTLPNGYVETRTYDAAGNITEVNNARSGTTLSDYAYTYDPVGNPTKVVQTGAVSGTTLYTYDGSNRLTDACYQATTCNEGTGSSDPYIHYTYDQVGNRLTEQRPSGTTTYTYDNADELTSAGSKTYTYDANGDQTSAGAETFTFNAANQVTSTTNNGTTTNYTYDGDGNRLQASSGSGAAQITNYLWDTNHGLPQLALERDGNNTALRSYIYGNGRVSMNSGGGAYYYLYDAQGSVVNLTSSSGATEWTYSYEPFGAIRTQTQNDPNAPANDMQFSGELLDYPNGLYDLRARTYDPSDGRFLTVDPMVDQTEQPYTYASDNPVTYSDPSGKITAGICGTFSVGALWWSWSASGCLSLVMFGKNNGQLGLTGTWGKGHGVLLGGSAGIALMVSNAVAISGLGKTFHYVTVAVPIPGAPLVVGGGSTFFWDGQTHVYGAELGVSVGLEAGVAYGHSYTSYTTLGGVTGWLAKKVWDALTPSPLKNVTNLWPIVAWTHREVLKYSKGY